MITKQQEQMKIDVDEFNRKAEYIIETVVKPQVAKYELSKQLNKYKMENKLNTGAIFKNTNKKAENHPDYKGKVNVNGKEMEVALWVKQGKAGSFFSAAFSEPYVAPETMERKPIGDSMDDDLPF
jgi:competence protein ComGC